MKLFLLLKSFFCLLLAVFSAAAWDFHLLGPRHEAGENCQVCAIVCSPELNTDCGTELITKPENFSLVTPVLSVMPARMAAVLSFYGRAPPLV